MTTLGIQAWSPNSPSVHLVPEAIRPVTGDRHDKPCGGFWTSTWDQDYGSGWHDWCVSESFGGPLFSVYLLTPDPTARVYTITDATALAELVRRYPSSAGRLGVGVDWAAVGVDYDAVRLTEGGHYTTRYATPGTYSWDCESTCWYRWCFTTVEHHGMWSPPSQECVHEEGEADSCWRCNGSGTVWLSRYDREQVSS